MCVIKFLGRVDGVGDLGGTPRRRLAGAEYGSRLSQIVLNCRCLRVRAAEHAPRNRLDVLERSHGLADIVERGAGVPPKSVPVIPPHPERDVITLAENASRHGYCFEQQCLGFFEVP